jgi:hypothetical protein
MAFAVIGKSIFCKESQRRNANCSIRFNFEFGSNKTDTSEKQFEKHDWNNISTEAGIIILCKLDDENAKAQMLNNIEFDSNETDFNELHHLKHESRRNFTDEGIVI